jgi:hypothetical protein
MGNIGSIWTLPRRGTDIKRKTKRQPNIHAIFSEPKLAILATSDVTAVYPDLTWG